MKIKDYYIGFFRHDDSRIWNKTNLNENKEELKEYLNNLQYIDKQSINIVKITLPE